jgi:hypothetical protein
MASRAIFVGKSFDENKQNVLSRIGIVNAGQLADQGSDFEKRRSCTRKKASASFARSVTIAFTFLIFVSG